ncbi:class I SAM-dependent methyltransferase [Lichenifustis flavocetrariae]|uniref:Class I SAM-dependent methyltransferase n=1 Tax=Lichenifustis flavocetrariae TaxID=2949735 RepID=A0AA41YZB1_9HYPH|nr:class I SAM-dependent methyltransferase [Lichenifustis flavocetrariae]MCW6511346.1 class I SAM-dependent methyltransferase [Lichenifustis flavocetrariae]
MSFVAQSLAFVRTQPFLYRLLGITRFAVFRTELAYRNWRHHRRPSTDQGLPLPPPGLRFRVGGSFDGDTFLRIGADCATAIKDAVAAAGMDLAKTRTILDFSCGCGRVIRHLPPSSGDQVMHGADIDAVAIAWCQEHLSGVAEFRRTTIEPPLPYATGQFDLIYVVSLFTHIDEHLQDLWLAELSRILAPGGLLVATIHGRFSQRHLPAQDKARMVDHGFVYQVGQTGKLKLDGLPDYYQAAYHSEAYVRSHWRTYVEPVLVRERGMNNDQDLVVLRKRA